MGIGNYAAADKSGYGDSVLRAFFTAFPDVAALAAAPEQELLKMWEGLGYYSRVRNMQKAAQQICEKYNGIFPNEYEQLLSLPGIGAYTAGAVASIAWNKPYAAVDGNVLRVVTRLTADSREISDTKFKNEITAALQEIYPVDKCGIFTQSLMELGAVVCMPMVHRDARNVRYKAYAVPVRREHSQSIP